MKRILTYNSFFNENESNGLENALAIYKKTFDDYCKKNERDQDVCGRALQLLTEITGGSEENSGDLKLIHKWLTTGGTLNLQELLRKTTYKGNKGDNSKETLVDFNAFALLDTVSHYNMSERKDVAVYKDPQDEMVPESDEDLNEGQIPVFKDVTQKEKEMVDQKDLAGFIKGKLDAVEEETDPNKQKPVLVIVEDPKYWQREFVVMELEGDNIKTQDRNKKPVVLKIKDVIGVFAS